MKKRFGFRSVFLLIFALVAYNFLMKTVSELKCGERAIVIGIAADKALCERLELLGIRLGAKIRVMRITFFKRAYLLATEETRVGMRRETAQKISVRVEAQA